MTDIATMFDSLPARKKLQLIRLTDILCDLISMSAEDEPVLAPEPVKKKRTRSRVADKSVKVSETA